MTNQLLNALCVQPLIDVTVFTRPSTSRERAPYEPAGCTAPWSVLSSTRGPPVPHIEVLKVQELFSYLLINRSRPHHREQLAETLWGDNRPDQARKYLRQTLWLLQSALGSGAESDEGQILAVDPQWVYLDSGAISHVDVIELERAFNLIRDCPSHSITSHQLAMIENAVLLYQLSLLDRWYQEWCLFERERLEMVYLILLQKLMNYCGFAGKYEQGIWYWHQILARDAVREQTHRQLMYLYAQSGDRTSALRQFERSVAILNHELDVAPSSRTVKSQSVCKRGGLI